MSQKSTDPDVFDTRVVERLIKNGVIQEKDYDEYLKSLPDQKDNSVPVTAKLEHVDVKSLLNH